MEFAVEEDDVDVDRFHPIFEFLELPLADEVPPIRPLPSLNGSIDEVVPRALDEGLDFPGVPGEGDEKDLHASMRTRGTSIRVSTGSRGVGVGVSRGPWC